MTVIDGGLGKDTGDRNGDRTFIWKPRRRAAMRFEGQDELRYAYSTLTDRMTRREHVSTIRHRSPWLRDVPRDVRLKLFHVQQGAHSTGIERINLAALGGAGSHRG